MAVPTEIGRDLSPTRKAYWCIRTLSGIFLSNAQLLEFLPRKVHYAKINSLQFVRNAKTISLHFTLSIDVELFRLICNDRKNKHGSLSLRKLVSLDSVGKH